MPSEVVFLIIHLFIIDHDRNITSFEPLLLANEVELVPSLSGIIYTSDEPRLLSFIVLFLCQTADILVHFLSHILQKNLDAFESSILFFSKLIVLLHQIAVLNSSILLLSH